jgi:dipeptidyl aminopeptidase/acylaminoacyl peptidase
MVACWGSVLLLLPVCAATAMVMPGQGSSGARTAIGEPRVVGYEDLINIVDLAASPEMDFDGLAVSPDKRLVTFATSQASLATNTTEIHWWVLRLAGRQQVIDLGSGGETIPAMSRGQPVGVQQLERPQWLPDSQWILYRKRINGSTQVWRTKWDGSSSEQLLHAPSDVERFVLSGDNRLILFSTRGPTSASDRNPAGEAGRGYLYDKRFSPLLSLGPIELNSPSQPPTILAYDLGTQVQRLATSDEESEFNRRTMMSSPGRQVQWRRSSVRGNASTWLEPAAGVGIDPQLPMKIVADAGEAAGHRIECMSVRCRGYFKGVWIDASGTTVYFLRWLGARDYGPMAIYSWRIGGSEPKEILRTDNFLQACSLVERSLLCAEEAATWPAHIVEIGLDGGGRRVVYDPNPGFHGLKFGEVQSLTWKNATGIEGFGHLVKPVGYHAGTRYPLVIVQYRSRGFLRGGVGDEYPIQVLAAKGFAVLSFHRPDDWEVLTKYRTEAEREQALWQDFRDRRRVLSVLRSGIDLLDRMGIVDRARVGITGLSDGANTAAFALIHRPGEFAAAAVAGTYWNPILYHLVGPLMWPKARWFGLDDPELPGADARWREISVSMNAASVETPLLIQVSDAELLPETETVSELQRFGKAFEMDVFPGEFHIKRQPVHRLNVYRRSVQWFEFWLQGIEEANPVDPAQYPRWISMQARHVATRLRRVQLPKS